MMKMESNSGFNAIKEKKKPQGKEEQLHLIAKSNILLNMGHYDDCIAVCDSIIARNDAAADAHYNAGAAWLNKAFEMEKTTTPAKEKQKQQQGRNTDAKYAQQHKQDFQDWSSPSGRQLKRGGTPVSFQQKVYYIFPSESRRIPPAWKTAFALCKHFSCFQCKRNLSDPATGR